MEKKDTNSLIATLKIIEAKLADQTQLLISGAKPKISHDNKIVDENTLNRVMTLMNEFGRLMDSDQRA
jgi:hypothetical protein